MAEHLVACWICGDDVDVFDRRTYNRVEGWERKGQNGGSDIVARQKVAAFAHPRCVDDVKRGLVGQEQLAI